MLYEFLIGQEYDFFAFEAEQFDAGAQLILTKAARQSAFTGPNYYDKRVAIFIEKEMLLNSLSNGYDPTKINQEYDGVLFWLCYDPSKGLFWAAQGSKKDHRMEDTSGFITNQEANVTIGNWMEADRYAQQVLGPANDYVVLKGDTLNTQFTFDTSALLHLVIPELTRDPLRPTVEFNLLLVQANAGTMPQGQYLTAAYHLGGTTYLAGAPCPPLCYYI